MSTKRGGLGKGLDAIFAENTTESGSGAVMLKISELEPNREQPRREFDEKSMAELAVPLVSMGFYSRYWCAHCLAGDIRLLPASAAGVRQEWPVCQKCPQWYGK